jgi:hypothetical protein
MVYGFKDGTLAVIAADLSKSVQATTACCVDSVDAVVCASHLRAVDLWRSLRTRIECEILALNARHGRQSSTVGSTHPCRVQRSCNWSTTWCCFGPYELVVDAMLRWAGEPATRATSTWRSGSTPSTRSPPTRTPFRGAEARSWSTSGSAIYARCASCGARHCAAIGPTVRLRPAP